MFGINVGKLNFNEEQDLSINPRKGKTSKTPLLLWLKSDFVRKAYNLISAFTFLRSYFCA